MYKNGQYIVLDVLIDNNPVKLVNYYASKVEFDQLKVLDQLAHIFDQLQIQKILRLSGVEISIYFLTSFWMQMEAPLNSKLSHFPKFFL